MISLQIFTLNLFTYLQILTKLVYVLYCFNFIIEYVLSHDTDCWSSPLETWKERFCSFLASASTWWSSFKQNCKAIIWFCWKVCLWWRFQGSYSVFDIFVLIHLQAKLTLIMKTIWCLCIECLSIASSYLSLTASNCHVLQLFL